MSRDRLLRNAFDAAGRYGSPGSPAATGFVPEEFTCMVWQPGRDPYLVGHHGSEIVLRIAGRDPHPASPGLPADIPHRFTAIPCTSKRAPKRRVPDPRKARAGNSPVKKVRYTRLNAS